MLAAGGSHEAGTRPTRESVTSASSISSINAAAVACKVQRHELKHHSLWSTKLEVQEKFLPDPSQFQVSADLINIYLCICGIYIPKQGHLALPILKRRSIVHSV